MTPPGAAAPDLPDDPAPEYGGGPPRGTPPRPISNARLAVTMLIVAETMLFTGLIGAYMALRGGAPEWPPQGQPRLPLAVTWVNTLVLLVSCLTMHRAVRALRARDARGLKFSLIETVVLGGAFMAIQGTEWVRLLRHGLSLSVSVYGATFYTLIGFHGLHVLAAVAWLLFVAARFGGDRFSLKRAGGTELCAIYWYFVCALWAVLFPLVYLY